ncbi:MAG: hypothetical protein GY928_16645 [Colwellia sp.]|nr:hypothetical protein [Colwellia sp.]
MVKPLAPNDRGPLDQKAQITDGRLALDGVLHAVGNFVTRHGIAVFLVVFYVVYIYPSEIDLRDKWVKEMALLRVALDPQKRPLDERQARAVLDFMVQSFTVSLQGKIVREIEDRLASLSESPLRVEYPNGDGSIDVIYKVQIDGIDFQISENQSFDKQLENIFVRYKNLDDEEIRGKRIAAEIFSELTWELHERAEKLEIFKYAEGDLLAIWEVGLSTIENDLISHLSNEMYHIVENARINALFALLTNHSQYSQMTVLDMLPKRNEQEYAQSVNKLRQGMRQKIKYLIKKEGRENFPTIQNTSQSN